MALETAKKQGTPNWADFATTDLGASEEFYAAVFGWTADRITGSDGSTYSIQRLEDNMVACIYDAEPTDAQNGCAWRIPIIAQNACPLIAL